MLHAKFQDHRTSGSGEDFLIKHLAGYGIITKQIRLSETVNLPESMISSSELSDDSVSKFTSLVRARD